VDEAWEAVRSRTRVAIVKWLCDNPGSQMATLIKGIGGQRITVRGHLLVLEQIGVVLASHPAGGRERHTVTYAIDLARWEELLGRLRDYPRSAR